MEMAEAETVERLLPVACVTDCRSLCNTIVKETSIPEDGASPVQLALFRQRLSAGPARDRAKAQLLWGPTRRQVADGLTKKGLSAAVRELMETASVVLRGESATAVGHLGRREGEQVGRRTWRRLNRP